MDLVLGKPTAGGCLAIRAQLQLLHAVKQKLQTNSNVWIEQVKICQTIISVYSGGQGMDANALSGMLGGGANAEGGLDTLSNLLRGGMPAVPPVANPEEAYASQLTQLRARLLFLACCNHQS